MSNSEDFFHRIEPKGAKTSHVPAVRGSFTAGVSLGNAVEKNQIHTVRELLNQGADPNGDAHFDLGEAPVVRAIRLGHAEIALLLLESNARIIRFQGSDPILRSHDGYNNLLYVAMNSCHKDIVRELLKHPQAFEVLLEYLSLPPIDMKTSTEQNIEMLATVLRTGQNPNIHFRDFDNTVKTPLTLAITREDVEMVKLLCDHKASVNMSMFSGRVYTPLMAAVYRTSYVARYVLTSMLLEKGARTNIQSYKGNTALHMAIHKRSSYDLIMLMLQHGADVCLRDHKGRTPYHTALARLYYPAFRLLLEAGVKSNINLSFVQTSVLTESLKSWLTHFSSHPRSLRDLSAMCVRSAVGERLYTDVQHLPVPNKIKSYLVFSHLEYLKPLFHIGSESAELSSYIWQVPT